MPEKPNKVKDFARENKDALLIGAVAGSCFVFGLFLGIQMNGWKAKDVEKMINCGAALAYYYIKDTGL